MATTQSDPWGTLGPSAAGQEGRDPCLQPVGTSCGDRLLGRPVGTGWGDRLWGQWVPAALGLVLCDHSRTQGPHARPWHVALVLGRGEGLRVAYKKRCVSIHL